MIELEPIHNEDTDFVKEVERLVNWAASHFEPQNLYVIHVDNWFGEKWLRFTSKYKCISMMTLPPFIPNRIVSERQLVRDAAEGVYHPEPLDKPFQAYWPPGPEGSYRQGFRYMRDLPKPSVFVWYSANTARNGRGSFMLYTNGYDPESYWFLSFLKKGDWKIEKHIGISSDLVATLGVK